MMGGDARRNPRLLGQLGVDPIDHLAGETITELAQLQQAGLELGKRRVAESLARMRQAQRLEWNAFQRAHLLAMELRALVEADLARYEILLPVSRHGLDAATMRNMSGPAPGDVGVAVEIAGPVHRRPSAVAHQFPPIRRSNRPDRIGRTTAMCGTSCRFRSWVAGASTPATSTAHHDVKEQLLVLFCSCSGLQPLHATSLMPGRSTHLGAAAWDVACYVPEYRSQSAASAAKQRGPMVLPLYDERARKRVSQPHVT